jgi:glucosamine--fructose-6-phosphate aminotransferase (isomerizing)
LAALALLSSVLDRSGQDLKALHSVPEKMQHTLEGLAPAMQRVERYRYIEQCVVIGRGLNYGTAFEVALKIKELTQVAASPYSSADFRHGPIATALPGAPVIVIAPQGAVAQDTFSFMEELRQRRSELLIISDDPQALDLAHVALPYAAGLPEWLTPLVAVLPGQRFAMQLTLERGMNPDQPEGLRKVTETY